MIVFNSITLNLLWDDKFQAAISSFSIKRPGEEFRLASAQIFDPS